MKVYIYAETPLMVLNMAVKVLLYRRVKRGGVGKGEGLRLSVIYMDIFMQIADILNVNTPRNNE